jgi:hypothetical protein
MLASVFVFIPFRQDEEEGLSDRDGSTAFGAVKLHGFKFIKISLSFRWWLTTRRDEVEGSFFHGQNLWISTMEYDRELGLRPNWNFGILEYWNDGVLNNNI